MEEIGDIRIVGIKENEYIVNNLGHLPICKLSDYVFNEWSLYIIICVRIIIILVLLYNMFGGRTRVKDTTEKYLVCCIK